ncbi:MAG: hypothetical protein PHY34_03230 [Patescibacteria group bacterium]|nr:hypothetical protein [Patescibacteria group bacterium]MDD5716112.1 hypothetical protein [Patescibacteria group bacterium]
MFLSWFIGNRVSHRQTRQKAERGKLFCPSCGVEFEDIDDSTVGSGLTCQGCGHVFKPTRRLQYVIIQCLRDRRRLKPKDAPPELTAAGDQIHSTPFARFVLAAFLSIGILPMLLVIALELYY